MWTPKRDVIMGAFRYKAQQQQLRYDFLPPERKPSFRPSRRPTEIADAEFVVIGKGSPDAAPKARRADARRPLPRTMTACQPAALALLAACVEASERWLQRASSSTFAAFVGALFILVFGLMGGFSALSSGPAEAASSGDPVHFTHVSLTPQDANGMRALLINGIVENASEVQQPLRQIRADLLSGNRLVASVVIAPPSDVIEAGQSRGFSTRLQHPGGKTLDVRLSFMPEAACTSQLC
ncbi:hypothetical protein [Rhizobium sp. BK251]|uniref:hypothetical protein n=1 Tax=Rhizobium sp. BK251 TaxID=2512125 RepID=UPI0010DC6979|nr:hypothetical protein [Rhizobium sp. BK251]TCL72674.1 hypothetical protein EV286_10497 [Rhizobium sp. BK251]